MKYLLTALLSASLLFIISAKQHEPSPVTDESLNKEMEASKHVDSIVLGSGCFWGAEKRYAAIPGVLNSVSGYAGGSGVQPTYKEITKFRHRNNPNNHAEVVKVTYNTSENSLENILKNYFEGHDPTQLNRQGNDIGTQYRSIILTNSPEQTALAKQIANQYQSRLTAKGFGKIVTQIKSLDKFFPAEEYHQDYLKKNPNGYCPDHSTGVTFVENTQKVEAVDNSPLTKGNQIVVIDSKSFCPYCEKFKKDVVANYTNSTPISFRTADQLQGLEIKTPTWATPTILFLSDGKEIYGNQGYIDANKFNAIRNQLNFL